MGILMATVVLAVALGAVTFRFAVVRPTLAITVLMTRWDGKRVGGAGSYVLAPTHD